MKKTILVILLCLIPFLCDAQQIIITKKKAAGGYTEEFYWTCEGANATARGTGKKAHRVTDIAGTYGTISDCSNDQAHGGTYSLLIGDDDEYITFPVTTGDIFGFTGLVSAWVYVATDPVGNPSPIWVVEGGSGSMSIRVNTSRTVSFYVWDGSGDDIVITSTAIAATTWVNIKWRWNFTTDNYGLSVDGGSNWSTSTVAQDAFTAPTVVRWGDPGWGPLGGNIYIDDVQGWNTYDGT